jgi:hypothetical protein
LNRRTDESAKDAQAHPLGQGSEGRDGGFLFHISILLELLIVVNGRRALGRGNAPPRGSQHRGRPWSSGPSLRRSDARQKQSERRPRPGKFEGANH